MSLSESVQKKYPHVVIETGDLSGQPLVVAKRENIRQLCESLKNDPDLRFDLLMDLFAVDFLHWEEKAIRFEVVYHLYSTVNHLRLFVKALVPEKDAALDSVTPVWPAANWYEREVWDMFGVSFHGHPNLKRILMYEEFAGHALRKDYPYNKRQPLIGPMN